MVLIGGSSKLPYIQRKIRGSIEGKPSFILSDVVPRDYGIETITGHTAVILKRFTLLPTRLTSEFKPLKMSLEYVNIVIYEGNQAMAKNNNKLRSYKVPMLPYSSLEEGKFFVTLEINQVIFNLYFVIFFINLYLHPFIITERSVEGPEILEEWCQPSNRTWLANPQIQQRTSGCYGNVIVIGI